MDLGDWESSQIHCILLLYNRSEVKIYAVQVIHLQLVNLAGITSFVVVPGVQGTERLQSRWVHAVLVLGRSVHRLVAKQTQPPKKCATDLQEMLLSMTVFCCKSAKYLILLMEHFGVWFWSYFSIRGKVPATNLCPALVSLFGWFSRQRTSAELLLWWRDVSLCASAVLVWGVCVCVFAQIMTFILLTHSGL